MEEQTSRNESGGGKSGIGGTIREKASGYASTAKEKANEQFKQRVSSATGELSSFASVLRQAGEQLRTQSGSAWGATALGLVADQVESLHGKVDGGDLDDVLRFVENFARRNSMAFVGTMFGLGFLAARFAKASSEGSHRGHEADLVPYDDSFSQPGYGLAADTPVGNPSGVGMSTGTRNSGNLGDLGTTNSGGQH